MGIAGSACSQLITISHHQSTLESVVKGTGGGVEMGYWSGVIVDTVWQVGGAVVGETPHRSTLH